MSLQIHPTGAITPYVFMRINDRTLAGVASNVTAQDEVGKARFVFGLSYDFANGLLTHVDLTLRLTIGMPVWVHRNSRPKAEQDEWDRFHRALRHHEDGHIAIFRAEAPDAYDHVAHSTPDTIHDVLDQQRARIQALSDAYDARTHHGLTQQTPDGNTVITVPP
jgi:predicted secreted Zn-dependent protease